MWLLWQEFRRGPNFDRFFRRREPAPKLTRSDWRVLGWFIGFWIAWGVGAWIGLAVWLVAVIVAVNMSRARARRVTRG